jgi:hypothetical protein
MNDATRRERRTRAAGTLLVVAVATIACGRPNDATNLTELQRLRYGTMDIVLLSARDGLRHGTNTLIIEFRSMPAGTLIDVGTVRASATMPMPGMPMFGSIEIKRTDVAGRYAASGEFAMAGSWRITIEWDGSAGHGSVAFSGTVQ